MHLLKHLTKAITIKRTSRIFRILKINKMTPLYIISLQRIFRHFSYVIHESNSNKLADQPCLIVSFPS